MVSAADRTTAPFCSNDFARSESYDIICGNSEIESGDIRRCKRTLIYLIYLISQFLNIFDLFLGHEKHLHCYDANGGDDRVEKPLDLDNAYLTFIMVK